MPPEVRVTLTNGVGQCAIEGDLLRCAFAELPPEGSVRIDLDAIAAKIGDATFSANVTAREHDSNTADNRAEVTVEIVPPVGFSVGDAFVSEAPGGSVITFPVRLYPVRAGPASVEFFTVSGTAKAGEDFVFREGTVELGRGVLETYVSIQIVDDGVDEPPEEFYLQLRNPIGSGLSIICPHKVNSALVPVHFSESLYRC